jgi:hypothetical protein
VSPAGPVDKPWRALIDEVRAWIGRKEREDFKGWFYRDGSWTSHASTRARVETRALAGDGETPEMWAVRYDHVDASVSARRWTTDIGVTQIGARDWRVSVALSHWLRPDYVGPEPARPDASSPGVIVRLMEGSRWTCHVGGVRVHAVPTTLQVGRANQFVRMLRDTRRMVPVVLVSCDRATGTPKIDAVRLSRALAGTAVVHIAASAECDDELEHFLPFAFRSPNGMVRVYAPNLDLTREWTSVRHPSFSPQEIDDVGDDKIAARIVRELTWRGDRRGLRSSMTSIADIDARVRNLRLTELRNSAGTVKERKELLELYEKANEDLENDKKRLVRQLTSERKERERLENSAMGRSYDVEQLLAAAYRARHEARKAERALGAVLELEEWPVEPAAVAALAATLYADRIVFADQGMRSLEKSDFGTCGDACAVLWRCLRAMATELHGLLMGNPAAQNADKEFRSRTGFELAWTETKSTKRDNKLMALRRIRYGAQDVDITPHVTWGDRAPKLLRVHFHVDRQNGKLVIGHCGDHLDTYGTRRRR